VSATPARIPESMAPLAVAISDLVPYHRNPRTGDLPAIVESLRVNGQYKAIVVNRGTHTGRPNEILAGNHTFAAAKELGWEEIAATWVDVDEETRAVRGRAGRTWGKVWPAGTRRGLGRERTNLVRGACPVQWPVRWDAGRGLP
jgi:hypothetical protein